MAMTQVKYSTRNPSLWSVVDNGKILINDLLDSGQKVIERNPLRATHTKTLEILTPRRLSHKRDRLAQVGDPLPNLLDVPTGRDHLLLHRGFVGATALCDVQEELIESLLRFKGKGLE